MSDIRGQAPLSPWRRIDPAVATAFACIVALLLVGSLYSPNFLSPQYLLQQLKVASFLGIIASGMMLAVLLGQIDLSLPWTLTLGAMMASAAAAHGPWGAAFSVPFGVSCGVLVGLVSGVGVALSAHSLDDNHARRQRGRARPDGCLHWRFFAQGHRLAVNALSCYRRGDPRPPQFGCCAGLRWGIATVILLNRTTFGRSIYGIGNRERAVYLSGVEPRRVVMTVFAIAGGDLGFRRHAARGLRLQGGASDGRSISLAGDCRRRSRRNVYPRRQGQLSRDRGGRDPCYTAAVDPQRHADCGIWSPDCVWRGYRCDAAALRTRDAVAVSAYPGFLQGHSRCFGPAPSTGAVRSVSRCMCPPHLRLHGFGAPQNSTLAAPRGPHYTYLLIQRWKRKIQIVSFNHERLSPKCFSSAQGLHWLKRLDRKSRFVEQRSEPDVGRDDSAKM